MPTAAHVVPPLAPHSVLIFLLDLVVLLVLARGLGALAQRFGMPAITGELLTGILLGPSLLGVLSPGFSGWLLPHQPEQIHLLDAVGQIGVLLLVGVTGTHLDLGMIRQRKRVALTVSFGGPAGPAGPGCGAGVAVAAEPAGRAGRHRVDLRRLPGGGDVPVRHPGDRQNPDRHAAAAPQTWAS